MNVNGKRMMKTVWMGSVSAQGRTQQYSLTYSLLQVVISLLETLNMSRYGNFKILTSGMILLLGVFILLCSWLFKTTAMEEGYMVAQWSFCTYHLTPVQFFPKEPQKATCWWDRSATAFDASKSSLFQNLQCRLSSILFDTMFKEAFNISP